MDARLSRRLAIAGAHNLRDLGGYAAADGRVLKWRTLYRSGAIHGLSGEDRAALRRLGIAAICDLRTPDERAERPMDWHDEAAVHYFGGTEPASGAQLEQLLTAYRRLPFEQAASYRHLFGLLAAGRLPLLFNCSAGKDRTGLAAALLLTALGVPRETVVEDYLLSNENVEALLAMMTARNPRYAALLATDPEALTPLLHADAAYLASAFAEIDERCGGFAAYLAQHLGTGPAELAQIRDHLLD